MNALYLLFWGNEQCSAGTPAAMLAGHRGQCQAGFWKASALKLILKRALRAPWTPGGLDSPEAVLPFAQRNMLGIQGIPSRKP